MRKPNFFIVGAGKCGTTALYSYLRSHPNIFMPRFKEPLFFASDLHEGRRFVPTFTEYLQLFRKAKPHQIAVGEASPGYMFSRVAIPKIREFNPDAKLIAMVRNPIEMTQSHHRQALYNLNEDEEDFERAWRLQEVRRSGERIPSTSRNPVFLQYAKVASLGEQVKRLFEVFPREKVMLIVFDDFVRSTLSVYKAVLEFLGVPYDGRTYFPAVNVRKAHGSISFAKLVMRPPQFLNRIAVWMRKLLRTHQLGIGTALTKLARKRVEKKPLSHEFKQELAETFCKDVKLLSRILDRDLSNWLA